MKLNEDMKKCSKCKEYLPRTNFASNPHKKDKLDYYCRKCNNQRYLETKNKAKIELDEKKCTKCNIIKDITEFYKRVGSIDGKTSECRDCCLNVYHKRFDERKDREPIDITNKVCTTCETQYDIDNFSKKTDSPDGYKSICKLCSNKTASDNRLVEKVCDKDSKTCNTCKTELPISNFWNNKSAKDGKDNKCKNCHKEKKEERKKNK